MKANEIQFLPDKQVFKAKYKLSMQKLGKKLLELFK